MSFPSFKEWSSINDLTVAYECFIPLTKWTSLLWIISLLIFIFSSIYNIHCLKGGLTHTKVGFTMLNETLKGSCFFQMHPLLKVKPMNYFFNYPLHWIVLAKVSCAQVWWNRWSEFTLWGFQRWLQSRPIFPLVQKLNNNADRLRTGESIKPTTVTDVWSTELKEQESRSPFFNI